MGWPFNGTRPLPPTASSAGEYVVTHTLASRGTSLTYLLPPPPPPPPHAQDSSLDPPSWSTANGTSVQYIKDLTDNYGFHHVATMAPLTQSRQYEYQCGDGTPAGWSTQWNFTMPSSDIDAPFSMSIFGDMGFLGSKERPMIIAIAGLKKDWSAVPTRQRLEALKNAGQINGVWHLGDIGYVDDSFAHTPIAFSYEKDYNSYINWLTNLSATMP